MTEAVMRNPHEQRLRIGFLLRRVELYHPARLSALATLVAEEGHGLEVAELSSHVIDHPVQVNREKWRFSCTTLTDGGAMDAGQESRKAVRSLHDWLEGYRPHAVCIVGYSPSPMRSAARWSRNRSSATVLISTTTRRDRRRFPPLEMAKRWWVPRHFDAAFTAGSRAAEYAEELGIPVDRIWRGCGVVDHKWWTGASERERSAIEDRSTDSCAGDFLFVGRLSPEKNLEVLLRAYAEYRNTASNPWGLIIVGEGPSTQELQQLADRLGADDIRWDGYRQPDELPALYAEASALVLPSTSESWGLVVNEALACGLPVLISEACGCVPELVYPGLDGYVFDPRDPGALATLLARASAAPERLARMGRFGRRIVSQFTPETWARALMDCVLTTVRRPSGSG